MLYQIYLQVYSFKQDASWNSKTDGKKSLTFSREKIIKGIKCTIIMKHAQFIDSLLRKNLSKQSITNLGFYPYKEDHNKNLQSYDIQGNISVFASCNLSL